MRYGIARVPDIVTVSIKHTIKAEVERLLHQFGERRDMQLKSTDFTSRKMTMVEGPNIGSNSPLIWALYNSPRSEEHTSELQSLMRITYAVFCWKKTKLTQQTKSPTNRH